MFRIFTMIILLVSSFCVAVTAELKPINDKTAVEIMNRLPAILIPANFVFILSFLVYAFLAFWLIGFWRNKEQASTKMLNYRALLFMGISFLNIFYIYLGHYEHFIGAIVTILIILFLMAALYFTYPKKDNSLFGRFPISFYFGWLIFNFMLLMNYTLTLYEWSGWGISENLWGVIFLTVTTAIGLHFLYHYNDFPLNIVLVIGFVGISIKNGFDSLFVSIASLFLSVVIIACFILFNNKKAPHLDKEIEL